MCMRPFVFFSHTPNLHSSPCPPRYPALQPLVQLPASLNIHQKRASSVDPETRAPRLPAQITMTTKSPIQAENLPSTEELKEDVKVATQKSFQSLRALVAGGVGGVCAVVVGHPFDLVKVRLQTAEKGVYSGAMDVVRKTIAREGLARGLYAGVSAPLVGVTPMCECSQHAKQPRVMGTDKRPE